MVLPMSASNVKADIFLLNLPVYAKNVKMTNMF